MRRAGKTKKSVGGFTLVEIIVGLVIGSISITLVATLIYPLFTRSVEPILQIRAAEYAQAILDDAMSKRYDQNTPVGGFPPCDAVTCSSTLDNEGGGANRSTFDDVDDYNEFSAGGFDVEDIYGNELSAASEYGSFTFAFSVDYNGDYDSNLNEGAADVDAKLLTVTVSPPPPAVPVTVSAYRANY